MGRVRPSRSLVLACVLILGAVAAQAQTFSVLHSFAGPDGSTPRAGVTFDRSGKMYGSTFTGSLGFGWGIVYQLRPIHQGWLYDVLQIMDGQPLDRPVIGPNGTVYGTHSNMITVYKVGYIWNLSPPLTICKTAYCFWNARILYGFQNSPNDGASPLGATLIFDQAGNLYGTTSAGGTTGLGTVYKMTPAGDEAPIYNFAGGSDAATPYSGVIFDSAGNLYGTTEAGGANGKGAVYKLSPNGDGWSEQVIYSFTGGSDGDAPFGGLVMDAAGNLIGTTIDGGTGGGGTVFELSPNGSNWNYSSLYSFSGGADCGPRAELAFDNAGNLYGTTRCDGSLSFGNVFKLTNSGGSWTYSSVHDFANGTDGRYPISNVAINASGNLFGTASIGGMFGAGNVWQITPQ